jgi:molybdenum cofactor guanylyltransferase
VLTAPCDCPLLAPDLAARLYSALAEGCRDRGAVRWRAAAAGVRAGSARGCGSLAAYLAGGDRKIDRWFAQHRLARVDFSDRPENFVNVNDPDERAALERTLAAGQQEGIEPAVYSPPG